MFRRIRVAKQTTGSECGLCCISMMASWFGYIKPISFFRSIFDVGRDGMSIDSIVDVFEKIGLHTKVLKIDNINELKKFNKEPIILYLKNHFVILKNVGNKKAKIYDPAQGIINIDISELNDKFQGIILVTTPNETFVKCDDKINDFKYIIQILKKLKFSIFSIIFFTMLTYLITIYIPKYIEYIINRITNHEKILYLPLVSQLVFIIIVFIVASVFLNKKLINLQQRIYKIMKLESIRKLFNISFSFFDNRTNANILYRLSLQNQVQNMISVYLPNIIINFASIVLILVYFLVFDIGILFYLAVLMAMIGVFVVTTNNFILRKQESHLAELANVTNIETEIVTNMFQIKCMNLDEYYTNQYEKGINDSLSKFYTFQTLQTSFFLVINSISRFLPTIFLIILTLNYLSEEKTIGSLVAIYTFVGMFINYSVQFFTSCSQMYLMKSSLSYINDIFEEPEILENRNVSLNVFENYTVNNLIFSYNDNQKNTLDNINIKFEKGKKYALIGLSGSGKTTLVKILAGLYNDYSGELRINNLEYRTIEKKTIKEFISIVPQIPVIFNKSLRHNITMGDSTISDSEVLNALETVAFTSELKNFPMGLDTFISSNDNLSGGQIQRIMIARALIRNPQFLILDEATSAVDVLTERKIYSNIEKSDITLLIITHRLSSIENVDQIFIMGNGKIIEEGSHKKLLDKNGMYTKMLKSMEK